MNVNERANAHLLCVPDIVIVCIMQVQLEKQQLHSHQRAGFILLPPIVIFCLTKVDNYDYWAEGSNRTITCTLLLWLYM